VFNTQQNDAKMYGNIKNALADHNIEIETLHKLDTVVPREARVWSLINRPDLAREGLHDLNGGERSTLLPFEVRYQLEVCISRDVLNEFNLSDNFITKLAEISSENPAKARNILEYIAEQDKRIYEPMTIFEDIEAMAYSPRTDIPHYCAYARKATITPTTVYLSTPTVETTNRVLRRYARENSDGRFLRVQFTDELSEVGSPIVLPIILISSGTYKLMCRQETERRGFYSCVQNALQWDLHRRSSLSISGVWQFAISRKWCLLLL